MRWMFLIIAVLAATDTGAQDGISHQELDRRAAEVQPQVVEWRRWFHQHPELSNREVNTSKRVAEILRGMGLEPRTSIAKHGVVAMIKGGQPGPLVAIRADMDGLPVVEQTGLPFASTATGVYNDEEVGVMHACGHDTHMAMALGAAKVLNDVKDRLPGSVMMIFQPAEEGPPQGEEGGAELMLEEGLWVERKPEAVFGIHIGLGAHPGRIETRPGPLMAAVDTLYVDIHGKQTHGARPWDGVDPIVIASQVVLGLQTIASRQVDVTLAPSIVTIGKFEGGVRNNVIPDSVRMEGTIRTFDQQMREDIHAAIQRTITSIAESGGATADVEIDIGNPPVVNDPELFARMLPSLERVAGEVVDPRAQTVGEDFSFFSNTTPGLYLFLGNGAPGTVPSEQPANHSPQFDVYEPTLETGVRTFTHLVVDYLQQEK